MWAGTNGKGSTCLLTASALRAAGYKTGLYLSPYLEDFRESMQIDGTWIAKDELAALVARIVPVVEEMERGGLYPTEYEINTVLAFCHYRDSGCDIAVLETGLGGTLDATNVIDAPLAAVIAAIDFDHTRILGNTLAEIAAVKCGILKKGGVAVSYPLQDKEAMAVISARAAEEGISLTVPDLSALTVIESGLRGTRFSYKGKSLFVPLAGEHQVYNALTALETLYVLRKRGFELSDEAIANGFASVRTIARQEILHESPLVLLDGSHNPQGMRALADTVKRYVAQRPLVVVMGILADKDYESAISVVAPLCDSFIAVRPPNPRALAPEITAQTAARYVSDATAYEDFGEAVRLALDKCGQTGAVVICGSLYQAAALRNAVKAYFC